MMEPVKMYSVNVCGFDVKITETSLFPTIVDRPLPIFPDVYSTKKEAYAAAAERLKENIVSYEKEIFAMREEVRYACGLLDILLERQHSDVEA